MLRFICLCLGLSLSLLTQAAPEEVLASASAVHCKTAEGSTTEQDNAELIDDCYYSNMSIEQAYHAFRQAIGDNMPEVKSVIFADDYKLSKNAKRFIWEGKNKVVIHDDFAVGIAQAIFQFDGQGTQVITYYLPD